MTKTITEEKLYESEIIEKKIIEKGLTEEVIKLISKKRNEPDFLLKYRLKAYRKWKRLQNTAWTEVNYPQINYQDITYYSPPNLKQDPLNFEEVGIPVIEQERLERTATDAVSDSSSIWTTYKKDLDELGILFCSISDGIQKYPEKVKEHLGKVVSIGDNYFSTLNSAVFTDGSFCYVPDNVDCPLLLETYFKINQMNVGQFERTLIVVKNNSKIRYREGCSSPQQSKSQLHAAVVEIVAYNNSTVEYSTLQNWDLGSKWGQGGIYNFVTKRGLCAGINSKISWIQVETGSTITWKYPSCILVGENSVGEFYSVTLSRFFQQTDTGSKMYHIGKNTRSRIISKGISAGQSKSSYRGSVSIIKKAFGSQNYSECDSFFYTIQSSATCAPIPKSFDLYFPANPGANTFPYISVQNSTSKVEHEASTSYMSEEQLFYFQQRNIPSALALKMIVSKFGQEVYKKMHMEFEAESEYLILYKLDGSAD